jgi:agmatine deiminase
MPSKRCTHARAKDLGYRMPAEWEPHEATWLAWPHNPDDWPGKFQTIPWVYAEIVRLLSAHERVHILVNDQKAEKRATGILERAGANLDRVSFHLWPTNRVWTRDSGRSLSAMKARWPSPTGASTPGPSTITGSSTTRCRRVAQTLRPAANGSQRPTRRRSEAPPRLEGGSIDTNGAGHSAHHGRVPAERSPAAQSRRQLAQQLEQAFHDYLGIDQVIWLNRGIAGDDTHGHVDDISRFVAPTHDRHRRRTQHKRPTNHEPLAENLARLKAARTLDGKQFTLVELPMPRPVIFDGQRLPASYANFYIANGLVLVPTFTTPTTA